MIGRRSDRNKRALGCHGQPPGTRPRSGLRRLERGLQRSRARHSAPRVGQKELNVRLRLSPGASLTPSLFLLLLGCFVLVAFSSAGSAGPAEQGAVRHSVQGLVGTPILQVYSTSEKSCQLCHDKGYCIGFEDKSSCEANKLVVEKKWDATLKWTCSCRTKKDQDTLRTGQSSLLLGRGKPRQQNLRQPKQDPESLGDQQSRQANPVRCPLAVG